VGLARAVPRGTQLEVRRVFEGDAR